MRVALVSGVPLRNTGEIGAAYYSNALAQELQAAGLDVEIWSKLGVGEAVQSQARIVPTWRPGLLSWLQIVRAVLRRRPDVVHVQHSMFVLGSGGGGEISMLLLLAALALLGVRVVVTCHDVPALDQIIPEYVRMHGYRYPAAVVILGLRVLFGMIGAVSKRVIVHQPAFADTLVHDFHVNRAKIDVVAHLPIPYRVHDQQSARQSLGIPKDDFVLLFFGFATRYKGIEALLSAMQNLQADAEVRLILGAGEHPKVAHTPEYERYYEALRHRAESTAHVQFAGFLPDERVDEYIDAADVAIFPYVEFQGMSGPLNQCASHGKPFLVSTRIAEKISGFSACVFEPEPSAIAHTISAYISDPQRRAAIQNECAQFADHVLGSEFVADTLAAYRRAAKETVHA